MSGSRNKEGKPKAKGMYLFLLLFSFFYQEKGDAY